MPKLRAISPISDGEARRLLEPVIAESASALLAVSGGPDSVALMRLFARLARQGLRCDVEVATVDHGLRPASRGEAETVGVWARECGFTHAILPWEGEKPSSRIQERARAARYALLAARARKIDAGTLVTAHTLDDQAETVLMRMAHGSGLSGLAAMRALTRRDGLALARPFLSLAKARLVATCEANAWPYLLDPSNTDPRFARARLRKLRAALAAEGLTASRLAKLAERAASAEEALEAAAEAAFADASLARDGRSLVLDMERLMRGTPREIVLRVLKHALAASRAGSDGSPLRLERVETLVTALDRAFAAGLRFKSTLGGVILAFDGSRRLALTQEGPRRRGSAQAAFTAAKGPKARARRAKKGNPDARLALV